jgi:hypothetical protein
MKSSVAYALGVIFVLIYAIPIAKAYVCMLLSLFTGE